jgi:hypothetical protein
MHLDLQSSVHKNEQNLFSPYYYICADDENGDDYDVKQEEQQLAREKERYCSNNSQKCSSFATTSVKYN